MTRNDIVRSLEALSGGVHPRTGEVLAEAAVLGDETIRRTLFAAAVLLEDGLTAKAAKPALPLAERNRVAGRPPRSHARWEPEEEQALRDHLRAGTALRETAAEMQRSPGALISRLQRMGLVEPSERLLAYDDAAGRARERLAADEAAAEAGADR